MKNEERIIELLAEMVKNQDITNQRLGNVESEIHKLNAQTQENTRAIVKLADKMEETLDLEKRVRKLESTVFK